MKKLLFVLFLMLSTVVSSQNAYRKYFSYPDKKIQVQIKNKYILWNHTKRVNNVVDKPDTLHYTQKGDTLFINEKTRYNSQYQIIIRKGKYFDYMRYSNNEYLNNECCGIFFRRNSLFFNIRQALIIRTTNRETFNRILELHSRLKRLKVFGKGCDDQLEPLYYELW